MDLFIVIFNCLLFIVYCEVCVCVGDEGGFGVGSEWAPAPHRWCGAGAGLIPPLSIGLCFIGCDDRSDFGEELAVVV